LYPGSDVTLIALDDPVEDSHSTVILLLPVEDYSDIVPGVHVLRIDHQSPLKRINGLFMLAQVA